MTLMRKTTGVPSWIDDFFGRDLMDWNQRNFSTTETTIPAVNVLETDDEYKIELAAPGMEKKDFDIQLDNDVLTISSEKKNEKKEEEETYFRREFSYQSFQRRFTLPSQEVDEGKIEARYADGILHLRIPKREEARPKPARKIAIR